jgi:hypothetical protein
METRYDLGDAAVRKLRAKVLDDGRQASAVDRELEIADRRAEEIGFAKTLWGYHDRAP